MLSVRRITMEEAENLPQPESAVLCSERAVLRVTATGLQLRYQPAEQAEWLLPRIPCPAPAAARNPSGQAFAAFEDGIPVALAALVADACGWAEVTDLRVAPAYRRKGAATAVLTACDRWVAEQGLAGLRAVASDRNPVWCQFLEHTGFRLAGMDSMLYQPLPEEKQLPIRKRACAIMFYRVNRPEAE